MLEKAWRKIYAVKYLKDRALANVGMVFTLKVNKRGREPWSSGYVR